MRLVTRRWLLLVLALLLLLPGLTGCGSSGSSTNGTSSSASIVLEARFPDGTTEEARTAVLDAAIVTIQRRLTAYGVTNPVVKKQGSDRILAKAESVSSVDAVVELITRPAYLEFAEVEMNGSSPATLKDYVDGNRTQLIDKDVPGSRMFYVTGSKSPVAILFEEGGVFEFVDKDGDLIDPGTLGESDRAAISWMPAMGTPDAQDRQLTGVYLTDAKAVVEETTGGSTVAVEIKWSEDGLTIFNQIAARLYGQPASQNMLGIVLDYDLLSSPQVMQPQYGDTVHIYGNFTLDEAKLLAIQLESGCLPIDFDVVSTSGG